ncbi:epiplakin [Pontoporia blainvillei]|uniref:Epiplakin n=1 Tax=Pontoporia blainvillei TaxID=48723 RepID=A0ABX0S6X8_PONBL|nr:epiplakin [Pontoporia blainvillei]
MDWLLGPGGNNYRSPGGFRQQKGADGGPWLSKFCAMNSHVSPLNLLVTNGPETAVVPETVKAVLGTGTPSGPQAKAATSTQARSLAGVYVEALGQAQRLSLRCHEAGSPALWARAGSAGGPGGPRQGQLRLVSEALQRGLATGKEVVDRALGWSWLEAQRATGVLVDPIQGVRVAPELACQQSLLDQDMVWAVGAWAPLKCPRLPGPQHAGAAAIPGAARQVCAGPQHGAGPAAPQDHFPYAAWGTELGQAAGGGGPGRGDGPDLREGRLAVPDVGARTEAQRHPQGTGGVAGVVLLPAGHKKSFFQASAEHLLPMGATLPVLEAQDATCMLVDPATGRQLWVDEVVSAGLFGPELHRQLLAAEQVVTGYHDPFGGIRIPLFQAMKRELVDRPPALRLLVTQLATGSLVCPAGRLRLPLEATLHFGCLDKESQQHLSQVAGFSDPGMQESLSCGQLLAHCVTDPETGLAFLPISVGSPGEEPQGPPFTEHSTWQALRAAVAAVSVGKFQGRPVLLRELLFSEAVPVEQRVTLTQQYKDGALSVEELAAAPRATHEQAAATARTTLAG